MAKIGLSKPYAAMYSATNNTVTYTKGTLIGKAVDLSIELEGADDNVLYADNGVAESANTFSGGSFTLTTDDLMPSVMVNILGVETEAISGVDGVKTEGASWYKFNSNQQTPYMGFGAIVKVQNNNVVGWQAIVLPKVQFQNPNDTFTTQGETIEWGTPEISGTIMRDDTEDQNWKQISSILATEAEAEALLKDYFNITA